jgi:hypothetical protein
MQLISHFERLPNQRLSSMSGGGGGNLHDFAHCFMLRRTWAEYVEICTDQNATAL